MIVRFHYLQPRGSSLNIQIRSTLDVGRPEGGLADFTTKLTRYEHRTPLRWLDWELVTRARGCLIGFRVNLLGLQAPFQARTPHDRVRGLDLSSSEAIFSNCFCFALHSERKPRKVDNLDKFRKMIKISLHSRKLEKYKTAWNLP